MHTYIFQVEENQIKDITPPQSVLITSHCVETRLADSLSPSFAKLDNNRPSN